MTREELFKKPCPQCGAKNSWVLAKRTIANGSIQYPFVCNVCHYISALYEKKALAEKCKNVVVIETPIDIPVCEVCGTIGAELHHWLPQHISKKCEEWPFSDSGIWPTSFLCVRCHNTWHNLVTPNMYNTG